MKINLKKCIQHFRILKKKVFYEMRTDQFENDQKILKELQQEILTQFKPFSIAHLYTEINILGTLLDHYKEIDLSKEIMKSFRNFESSNWGKENPELNLFFGLLALNHENQKNYKDQEEIAKKGIEIITKNFGIKEFKLLNFQSFLLEAEVNLGKIESAKKTLKSIDKEYLDINEWHSAKVLTRIHKAACLIYLKTNDYQKAKLSQSQVLKNMGLYLDNSDFRIFKEVVRYRDILVKLNDFDEINKLDRDYDFYPIIK